MFAFVFDSHTSARRMMCFDELFSVTAVFSMSLKRSEINYNL